MSACLVIFPTGGLGEPTRWVLVDQGARVGEGVLASDETWTPPGGAPTPVRAIAVLPAGDVSVHRMTVPGRTEREARQAAPFLIEEQLAAPVEASEVVIGPKLEDDARLVFAADPDRLAAWRAAVARLPVRPVAAAPDAMLLSGRGADLTVMAVEGRLLFQTRAGDLSAGLTADEAGAPICGAIDAEFASPVLAALGARVKPKRLLISPNVDPHAIAPDNEPIALKREPAPDLALAAAALDEARLALLPSLFGAGAMGGAVWMERARAWRMAAGLALAAALAWAGLNLGEGLYYDHRAEAYRAASEAAFRAEFPDMTRVVNPRAQLAQRLAALGGGAEPGGGFLELANGLARLLEEVEQVQVETVRYDARRSVLSVSAAYSDFSDFEALRAAAERLGLEIIDGGARQSESGVAGEFSISRGGA